MEEYGHRLMPHVLHDKASRDPDQVFASVARSEKIEDGFRTVTYQQVSRAVNYVACWLLEHFPQLARHETITYIGVSDLRYNILFYAAVQIRLKVSLLLSSHLYRLSRRFAFG
jgi:acyl-coenzyme A synthetase/AMP-(fatty) acid ligase